MKLTYHLYAVLLMHTSMSTAQAKSLLLISIDAMGPDYVTKADALGLKLPNMRRFMAEGSYASGVRGVVPSITCPSHATIVTGVTPSRHGIIGNEAAKSDGYSSTLCTFASDIKVDTLWDAAARVGIESGSVGWLNTAGAVTVKYNLPHVEPYESAITVKYQEALARPEGLLKELEAKLGSYYQDGTETGSAIRTRFATEILRRYKPGLMLFHIIAVDHAAHAHGPLSVEAKKAIEHEDAMIGEIVQASLANDPDTVVAIVSDHGQVPVTRAFNINVALIDAGLIEIETPFLGRPVKVKDAKVRVQVGASGAIYLKDPTDDATRTKVSEVLRRLAADPASGIDRIVEGSDVEELGGYPDADFVIGMKPGTVLGSDYTGARLLTYPTTRGTHGYLPEVSGMNASFFIKGTGIKVGQDLGVIDMVRIAPTLAQVLGVKLKDTAEPSLAVFKGPIGSK